MVIFAVSYIFKVVSQSAHSIFPIILWGTKCGIHFCGEKTETPCYEFLSGNVDQARAEQDESGEPVGGTQQWLGWWTKARMMEIRAFICLESVCAHKVVCLEQGQ